MHSTGFIACLGVRVPASTIRVAQKCSVEVIVHRVLWVPNGTLSSYRHIEHGFNDIRVMHFLMV